MLRLALAPILAFVTLIVAAPAGAVNSVVSANGTTWQIHDASAPGVDTGSIRTASSARIEGFGNIVVRVSTTPEPRLNGEMMRGFGMRFDGLDRFRTTRSVELGGVSMTRSLRIDRAGNWGRFLDSFTNTSGEPVDVEVSFGGALGYDSGTNQSMVVNTSSGDTSIEPDDSWSVTGYANADLRPVGIAIGTPEPYAGLAWMGNHELDPFADPLATTGHSSNFQGYVNELTLAPGETATLMRFVVIGPTGTGADSTVETAITDLATAPVVTDLSTAEVCALANWDPATLPGFDPSDCAAVTPLDLPPAPPEPELTTASPYDVTDKTIAEMQADMEEGAATSEDITRAYLDRIAVYDTGQLGFHSFILVADDAIEQARAADEARERGETGELLGIPIALKDLYDTKDMPTTGGTLALEGWQPEQDAYQVELMREAGAVLIGKTNMSEFANSGSYSESGWGQVWNALYPSKTSFGSSGGSAVAVAASMAAGAMGSQTGVSLYAPTVGSSLTTFRGTDGMASTRGVMPLSWAQDYAGPIARSVTDLAYMLNVTTGTDPQDLLLTEDADANRPDDWTEHLDADALEGKRIGYIPSSFVSSYAGEDGTGDAVLAELETLEDAGAELVEIGTPPSAGSCPCGSNNAEGWARYIELHDDFPYPSGNELHASPRVLAYNRPSSVPNTPRMTEQQVSDWLALRDTRKETIDAWMDSYEVDAVVYAGFISDMFSNDTASSQHSADRGTGVITSTYGVPTVVVPVGTNPHGYSISLQLVGRAWDDPDVLAMGYALEQEAQGQQSTSAAPPLIYDPSATPKPIEIEVPGPPVNPVPPEVPEEPGPGNPPVAPGEVAVNLGFNARLKGGKIRIKVRNAGKSRVKGRVVLRIARRKRTVIIGSGPVNIGAGQARRVTVKLNRRGMKLVRKRLKSRKRVSLTAVYDLSTAEDARSKLSTRVILRR